MNHHPLLIGIIAAATFIGTTVVSAQTDMTANLSDPNNAMWQGIPGSTANGLPVGATPANFPDMPVTFRQVIWLISQYDHFVVQPMRMQIASLQQQVNSIQTTSFSSTGFGSCGVHQIGDTYAAPDNCNICTCTANGQICTQRACQMSSSSFSNIGNLCGGHQIGDRYWNGCSFCTCTSNGPSCTMNACQMSSSSSSFGFCNYSMCIRPPAGCYQDRTNPAYGCCGRIVCPTGFGSSAPFNGGSCGNHQIGDQYWVGNCNICTCTANGQVCTTSNDPGCHQASSSCQSVDCAAPPVGCHYANSVFANGCMLSCGQLVCNGQSSFPTGGGVCANGHQVGDQYWIDNCNTCTCTTNGQVCSNHCSQPL